MINLPENSNFAPKCARAKLPIQNGEQCSKLQTMHLNTGSWPSTTISFSRPAWPVCVVCNTNCYGYKQDDMSKRGHLGKQRSITAYRLSVCRNRPLLAKMKRGMRSVKQRTLKDRIIVAILASNGLLRHTYYRCAVIDRCLLRCIVASAGSFCSN